MLDILLFTVNSILPIILLIVLGYLLKLRGFFTPEFLKRGNKLVFYVCLPALLFKNVFDINSLSEIRLDVLAYCLILIAIMLAIGAAMTLLIPDARQKGVIHQCVFRSNFALIGVPLAELMGGDAGVRTAAILALFSIPIYNMLAVVILTIYKDGKAKPDIKKVLKDICRNPLIIGTLLGFAAALLKMLLSNTGAAALLEPVSFPYTALSYVARAATPLSLFVLGGQFDFQRIAGYRKQLTLGIAGRNFLAPLLGVGIAGVLTKMGILQFGPDVFATFIAFFGTPVAVASAIMAEAMDNDGQLAGQLVVWTSLISIFSLFIIIFLTRACGLL